jgi:uncharacterized membrane protein
MLTDKESDFLKYWEKNRDRQKKWLYQLAFGLPFGGILAVIILVNFFSGWYKRAEMIANSNFNPAVLYVAAAAIAIFMALFSKKFQWDQQEKRYKELQAKANLENVTHGNAAKSTAIESTNQTENDK